MKDRPRPGWPSTGCAHGSGRWPERRLARSWCAAGPARPRTGPQHVACAPQPPTAVVSLDRTSMRPNPTSPQITADELLEWDGAARLLSGELGPDVGRQISMAKSNRP